MPIMFNTVLREVGLTLKDVRLLRHKDPRSARGRSPYELWRDNRSQFEVYQATQSVENRSKLKAPFWASFLGTPTGATLFVGVYRVLDRELLSEDAPRAHMDGVDKAGSCDIYSLYLEELLGDLIGRLLIDWGPGQRSWIQRADRRNKPIEELWASFQEPEFPGFLSFMSFLSELERLPNSWRTALRSCKGVYLLTCPTTKEQYVGSATGGEGFWGRWLDYIHTGHGGNLGLRSREPTDYQVSILEVAGTATSDDDIVGMEERWKAKLQSREMGLNR